MDFNSMLIGTDNKDAMVEYYTKVLGEPSYTGRQLRGLAARLRLGQHRRAFRGPRPQCRPRPPHLEHRDQGRPGRVRSNEGRRRDRRHRAVRLRWLPGRDDRHLRGPRRQLLPAHDPDGDVASSSLVARGQRHRGRLTIPVGRSSPTLRDLSRAAVEERPGGVLRRSVTRPLTLLLVAFVVALTAPVANAATIPTTTTLTLPPGPVQISAPITFKRHGDAGAHRRGRVLPDRRHGAHHRQHRTRWRRDRDVAPRTVGRRPRHHGDVHGKRGACALDERAAGAPRRRRSTPGARSPSRPDPNPQMRSDPVALHAVVTPDPGDGSVSFYWRPGAQMGAKPIAARWDGGLHGVVQRSRRLWAHCVLRWERGLPPGVQSRRDPGPSYGDPDDDHVDDHARHDLPGRT